jgi:hypothetical protein
VGLGTIHSRRPIAAQTYKLSRLPAPGPLGPPHVLSGLRPVRTGPLPGRRLAEAPLIHADGLVWVCNPSLFDSTAVRENINKNDSTGSGTSFWPVSLIISPQARGSASCHVLAARFQPAVNESQICLARQLLAGLGHHTIMERNAQPLSRATSANKLGSLSGKKTEV